MRHYLDELAATQTGDHLLGLLAQPGDLGHPIPLTWIDRDGATELRQIIDQHLDHGLKQVANALTRGRNRGQRVRRRGSLFDR